MNPMKQALPLVFADPDQVLFYRQQTEGIQSVTARQFVADARALAAHLGAQQGAHHPIVNLCQDRYRFMVGFAATILAGKTNLLPSTYTSETLRQIFIDTPNALCLHDQADWPFPYAHLSWPDLSWSDLSWSDHSGTDFSAVDDSELINPDHSAAQVFTSGSTGRPVPHDKTWGKLVQNVQAAQKQQAFAGPMSLVGTVPPQHMFGFESLVLLCLIGRCPLWSGKPFYPADIVTALEAMPEPRMLVTTPFHLQALLDAQIALPAIARLLLATAPLSPELAARAECRTGAPLFEIYGSTETGQMATRRPTQSQIWTLLPGITLSKAHSDDDDDLFIAKGGHIEVPVLLSDRLRLSGDDQFQLLGRVADQVNMAGKRSSLNYLTAQIKAIDGVIDGVFFLPETKENRAGMEQVITRLCALVVAPSLNAASILHALRDRLDPVFLPRPLILVNALPYNATGKLPQVALQAALNRHHANRACASGAQMQWHIPADHPVFSGHFPDHPLVPGALLLDWVVARVAAYWRVAPAVLRIEQAKFLHPVLPDAHITLSLAAEADRCRFTLNLAAAQSDNDRHIEPPVAAVTGLLSRASDRRCEDGDAAAEVLGS